MQIEAIVDNQLTLSQTAKCFAEDISKVAQMAEFVPNREEPNVEKEENASYQNFQHCFNPLPHNTTF